MTDKELKSRCSIKVLKRVVKNAYEFCEENTDYDTFLTTMARAIQVHVLTEEGK